MKCPKCHKPLTPTGKPDRMFRCTNPDCSVIKVCVERGSQGETVTEIGGQANSVSEGVSHEKVD